MLVEVDRCSRGRRQVCVMEGGRCVAVKRCRCMMEVDRCVVEVDRCVVEVDSCGGGEQLWGGRDRCSSGWR